MTCIVSSVYHSSPSGQFKQCTEPDLLTPIAPTRMYAVTSVAVAIVSPPHRSQHKVRCQVPIQQHQIVERLGWGSGEELCSRPSQTRLHFHIHIPPTSFPHC